jgi:ParB family transcriptional regulator, chromosome partitioning protein
MVSSKKLGRGLGSLLTNTHASDAPEAGGPLWVAIEKVVANTQQPRKETERGLERLAESLRRHGMMQPIVVTENLQGQFEILAGERRWRASQIAGLKRIPVILRAAVRSQAERLELALIENIQREDLDSIERAGACARLIREYGLSQEQVAERLGYERSTVANLVRLLDLPASIQEAVSRETISAGHARALLRLNGSPEQESVFKAIASDGMSVRAAEAACKEAVSGSKSVKHQARPNKPAWILEMQEKMERKLGLRVEVQLRRGKGGKMILHFADLGQLDQLSTAFQLPSEAAELLEG